MLGAQPLGKIEAGFSRAKFVDGARRTGVASPPSATWSPRSSAGVHRAQIAFMNPGGLRADMMGTRYGYPRTVTYKNAADVQPFANTLVTMEPHRCSIKKVLEQQWQRTASGTVPSRPFLKLGVSEGFDVHLRPDPARGRPDHRDVAQRRRR